MNVIHKNHSSHTERCRNDSDDHIQIDPDLVPDFYHTKRSGRWSDAEVTHVENPFAHQVELIGSCFLCDDLYPIVLTFSAERDTCERCVFYTPFTIVPEITFIF